MGAKGLAVSVLLDKADILAEQTLLGMHRKSQRTSERNVSIEA
ncbi:MAG TPA: hypothetical protein VN894_05225 [Polyangiaceae bacterium]|nr:hypothetical protein [Polyangiaceae bacterium]